MSTDRHHLEALLRALAGPEDELIKAIQDATAHLEGQAIPGLEVKPSSFGEWLESGGERRSEKRSIDGP